MTRLLSESIRVIVTVVLAGALTAKLLSGYHSALDIPASLYFALCALEALLIAGLWSRWRHAFDAWTLLFFVCAFIVSLTSEAKCGCLGGSTADERDLRLFLSSTCSSLLALSLLQHRRPRTTDAAGRSMLHLDRSSIDG